MQIQILGTGCARCARLAEVAERAAEELEVEFTLEKVQEIDRILALGVLSTPALLVDGRIRVSGKVPSVEEMKKILKS